MSKKKKSTKKYNDISTALVTIQDVSNTLRKRLEKVQAEINTLQIEASNIAKAIDSLDTAEGML